MSSTKEINVQFLPQNKINVEFKSTGLNIEFKQGAKGERGATGPAGTTDHALLTNLDYAHAGHPDFQKKLDYISAYKAYEIP